MSAQLRILGGFAWQAELEGKIALSSAVMEDLDEDLRDFEHACHEFGHAYSLQLPHEEGMHVNIAKALSSIRPSHHAAEHSLFEYELGVAMESEAAALAFTLSVFDMLGLSYALAAERMELAGLKQGVPRELLNEWVMHHDEPREWAESFIQKYNLPKEESSP